MERQGRFFYVLIFSAHDIGLLLKLFSETRSKSSFPPWRAEEDLPRENIPKDLLDGWTRTPSHRYEMHSHDNPTLSQPQALGRLTPPSRPAERHLPPDCGPLSLRQPRHLGRAQPRRALARRRSAGGGRRGAQRRGGGAGGPWRRERLRREDGRVPDGRGGNGTGDRGSAASCLASPFRASGGSQAVPVRPDPTPRRPPLPSLSPCPREEPRIPGTGGRRAQPLFCRPREPAPCPAVHRPPRLWLLPLPLQVPRGKGVRVSCLGLPRRGGGKQRPAAAVGAGRNSSVREDESEPAVCVTLMGRHTPFTRYGVGYIKGLSLLSCQMTTSPLRRRKQPVLLLQRDTELWHHQTAAM